MAAELLGPGILLVSGAAFFFIGGFGIAGARPEIVAAFDRRGADRMREIAKHPRAWVGIMISFGGGIALTAAGLASSIPALAARVLLPSLLAALSYLCAAVLMMSSLALQGGWGWAAARRGRIGHVARWVVAWAHRAYSGYMVGAYAAIAVFGIALAFSSRLEPVWGWGTVLFALAFLSVQVIGRPRLGRDAISDYPLWVHVWGIILGIAMIA